MTYYNTNRLRGNELSTAEKKAKSQNEQVLEFFRSRPGQRFTGWQILKLVFHGTPTPFTSVCRALDTLHKAGKISQTSETVVSGPYGKKCHLWELSDATACDHVSPPGITAEYKQPIPQRLWQGPGKDEQI